MFHLASFLFLYSSATLLVRTKVAGGTLRAQNAYSSCLTNKWKVPCLIFLCTIGASGLAAQTPVSTTQTEATDASALEVVSHIASAAGCAASAVDVLATGTLTTNGTSERLVITARPQHQI